jgi:hypothetical protein
MIIQVFLTEMAYFFLLAGWELLIVCSTTGAPTCLMVNAQGETICRPCPKPSDPLLGTMIEEALAEK